MFYKPKVSVIIPCYNSAAFLEKAVDSVLAQSLSEIEIILVDDGSTDKTAILLQHYKMSDNRIEVITHQKNVGLGAARNSALEKVKGTYIFFLDSDDYIHQNTLEVVYDKAQKEDLDILQMQHTVILNGKKMILPQNLIPFEQCINGIQYYNSGTYVEPKACAKLWKTAFMHNHNLQFTTGFYEDIAMVFYAFSVANRVNNLMFSGYHYVQREDSITNQQISKKHIKDYQTSLMQLQQLFMNPDIASNTSIFPASFAMFLVDLCKMAKTTNNTELIYETKGFVAKMLQKYKIYIKANKRLLWIKRFFITLNPSVYLKLKKIIGY